MSTFYDLSLVEEIPSRLIRQSPNPLRRELSSIEELVASIRQHGLLQPIVVRPHGEWFEVVAGNRRFAACRSLRWLKIPCIVKDLTDKEAFELALTENVTRKSLDPFEEAEAFRSYVLENGWGSATELASKLGKSPAYVSQRLSLLRLPEKVRTMVVNGGICVSTAREIAQVKNKKRIYLLASLASAGRSSSRQTREYAAAVNSGDWRTNPFAGTEKNPKALKKYTLILKMAMARLTSLIEKTEDETVREYLTYQRAVIHDMIDRAIRMSLKWRMINRQ